MDVVVQIAHSLVGYEDLLATMPDPCMTADAIGTFASEAACAADVRETVGISPERISESPGALAAGIVEPLIFLPLSRAEAQRVITEGVVFQKWRWPCLHCPSKGVPIDEQANDDVMQLSRFREAPMRRLLL
jgi:hypothetical protein